MGKDSAAWDANDHHNNKTYDPQSGLHRSDSSEMYQYNFPCPECTVQCDTSVGLLRHMRKIHTMTKEELAKYRKMFYMARRTSKRCECKFPNCKRRFKNSAAAEAHFRDVHDSCNTEQSTADTLSVHHHEPAIVEEESVVASGELMVQCVEVFPKDSAAWDANDHHNNKTYDPQSGLHRSD